MRYLDITAVAKQSGVAASALRYYEAKGLIASYGISGSFFHRMQLTNLHYAAMHL